MADLKVACWNIYFSHNLIQGSSGSIQVNPNESKRTETIVDIIKTIDADILGIIECMPLGHLLFLRDSFLPDYGVMVEGGGKKLNLGLLYKPETVGVERLPFDKSSWQASIGFGGRDGFGGREKTYRFSRTPLIAGVLDKESGERFALGIVHMKSKKTYTADKKEPFANRRKIVAQSQRTREIMAELKENYHRDYKRFMVIGDVNDGPGFDKYEAKIVVSGIETLLGTVFEPKSVYVSFSDLANGGIPTTPFAGAPQLDHILYSQAMERAAGARIVKGSGLVRSDLVNFSTGSGKDKDSDHAPVEIRVSS